MKNKIPVLFTVLLMLTLSVFDVSADDASAIPERGQEVQQMPQDGRGQMPALVGENQMPEMNMDGNMPQRGGFNPMEQGGFPFEQETQITEETEKPYEKWITPIVSAVLLVFGFVFVALYKRKEY